MEVRLIDSGCIGGYSTTLKGKERSLQKIISKEMTLNYYYQIHSKRIIKKLLENLKDE